MQSPVLERLVGGAVLVGLLLILALVIGPREGVRMPDERGSTVPEAPDTPQPAGNGVATFPDETGGDALEVAAPEWTPPNVAANEPEATASPAGTRDATGASAPSGRWAVQIGNFSRRANADDLADWCREQGYGVKVSPHTSGDQTQYRVRVGPYASRADAASARAELALRNRNGFVADWDESSP